MFFGPSAFFSLPAAGLSSCSRLHGTQGARADPIHKFGLRARSVARALGVQSGTFARGGIPSTYESHPGPCKPTRTWCIVNRLNKCPTSHVISGILNVINVVRHTWKWKSFSPTTYPICDHLYHSQLICVPLLRN